MSGIWVAVCGLVRDEKACETKIDQIKTLIDEGVFEGAVFSTWIGELDGYPKILDLLTKYNFKIVESSAPTVKVDGHILHQSKTLHFALEAVPVHASVLKIRPDLGELTPAVIAAIQDIDLEWHEDYSLPKIFSKKILIASSFSTAPFYMNDIVFFGQREDLKMLASFDLSIEYLSANTAPEQNFFRHLFKGKIPQLEAYLQIYPHYFFDDPARSKARLDLLLDDDFFLDVLAWHLKLLKTYFRIGFCADSYRKMKNNSGPLKFEDYFCNSEDAEGIFFHNGTHETVLVDERALDHLLEGHFCTSPRGVRFLAALARTSTPGYREQFSSSALYPHPGLRALQAKIAAQFPDMPHRLDVLQDEGGKRFRIIGPAERVRQMTQIDESQALHAEVNHLRRVIDKLRKA